MAHAWVEIFFPYIGWISFDPTSQNIAEGEELNFGINAGDEEFNALLAEILEKRDEILITEETEENQNETNSYRVKEFFIHNRNIIFIFVFTVLFLIFIGYKVYPYLILKFSKNKRRVILTAGYLLKKNKKAATEQRTAMQKLTQKAKFAPRCTEDDVFEAVAMLKEKKRR